MLNDSGSISDQFLQDLRRDDEISLVLRGHLHIEQLLVEFLRLHLPCPDSCDLADSRVFTYSAKVKLAAAYGLQPDAVDLLERIGKLRNRLAHKITASLSRQDVLNLYNSLSHYLQEAVRAGYDGAGRGSFSTPADMDHKELLAVILIVARQILLARQTIVCQELERP